MNTVIGIIIIAGCALFIGRSVWKIKKNLEERKKKQQESKEKLQRAEGAPQKTFEQDEHEK